MDPALQRLTSVAGAAVIVSIVVQVILTAWKPDEVTRARFAPLLALVVGVVVVELALVGLGQPEKTDVVQGIFTGLVAGATAMGIHDLVDIARTRPAT